MIELRDSDLRTDEQLRQLGYSSGEIDRYVASAMRYNELAKKLAIAEKAQNWDTVLDLEPQIADLVKYLKYLGRHPKLIPISELKELATGAADTTEAQFRDKIANPATAIRAFCVMCMGGNPAYVRDCEAVSCTLWPFRTGKNPLFGKVLPPVELDTTIDPTEPEEEAEDETDNQDAD